MAIEKLLPQNVEAEAGVLGSLLIDPDAMAQVAPIIKPDDFYREAHRAIFQAAQDLYEDGTPADFITLCDELARRGKLDEIGGTAYIGALANQVPTSRNAVHYALIVERTGTLRRLIHAAGQIAGVAYNEPDADAALEQAEKLVREVARRRPERDGGGWAATVDEMLAEFLDGMEGRALGMTTGFRDLDAHMAGGLRKKELGYLIARPKTGKTMFAARVGVTGGERCASEREGCVEWFTMEMSRTQQAKRVLASLTGINSRILRASFRRPDGTIDAARWQAAVEVAEASKRRLDGYLFVRDASYTVEGLYAQLRRAVTERNCRLGIVDYFGLLTREAGAKGTGRTERMTEISRQLKEIARDLDIPLWVLAQANREAVHRDNPRLQPSDFRDTGAGEQDADWMFALHAPADYDRARAATDKVFAEFCELSVLLARDGEGGVILPLRRRMAVTSLEDWPDTWAWPEDPTRPAGVSSARQGAADADEEGAA